MQPPPAPAPPPACAPVQQVHIAEGLDQVKTASTFRSPAFGEAYGVTILDGAFAGLLARSVVVLDIDGKVLHSELVPEIAEEPNYDAAIAALG